MTRERICNTPYCQVILQRTPVPQNGSLLGRPQGPLSNGACNGPIHVMGGQKHDGNDQYQNGSGLDHMASYQDSYNRSDGCAQRAPAGCGYQQGMPPMRG